MAMQRGSSQCMELMEFATPWLMAACCVPLAAVVQLVTNLHDAVLLNDPTTEQFIKWTNNKDAPLMLTTYVWDIQNPEEVVMQGAKPNAVEMGPYVFKVRPHAPRNSRSLPRERTARRWRCCGLHGSTHGAGDADPTVRLHALSL